VLYHAVPDDEREPLQESHRLDFEQFVAEQRKQKVQT
jgi:hypothetical protein